ncbi:uncharacterized protein CIMG_12008 [Coccidioides immitis RS]|uniref:Uncharacterized protein n=4 Tax=Coccidioides immitis TaxID=5501 RepID=A0A0D8JUD4_COCIM|nr:uncharacterized protein CIMG_12008 [Coccidioides immitis RS]KJF60902.1 hypothetical protein CIMG_12008 [Coccidioides immitis RS]KMP06109.1 hypothetical protein CIRG_05790 [Coccidioides immitis RMSCC 2394]KMU79190.1 hypothetical protein CISG_07553 [Coccidioides immitis RMSCC 3703]KMU87788.1 hypothetical protein CIHG_05557 [Coccidioides immitis H538.4]
MLSMGFGPAKDQEEQIARTMKALNGIDLLETFQFHFYSRNSKDHYSQKGSAFVSHPAPAYTCTKRADVFAVLSNERARKDAVPLAAPLNEQKIFDDRVIATTLIKATAFAFVGY